jgi:hypothetical protein
MLKNFKLNQTTSILLLCGIFLVQMYCYNYKETLHIHPRNIHSWRQTDCLSFVLNFYNGRGTFTEPCVNNLGNTDDGKIASDFPLVQYTVAQIWKITGKSELIFRLIELGFLFMGLLYIYKLALYWTENYFLSIATAALVFTSPILAYYGTTFLSDIQAFGLICGGFYFVIKWLNEKKRKQLVIAILFFLFAGWCKMSSVFVYAIALLLIAREFMIGIRSADLNYKKINFIDIVLLCVPFIAWYLWYHYATNYNNLHPNHFFLIGILPIWELNAEKQHFILMKFLSEILPQMLHSSLLLVIFVTVIAFSISKIKRFFSEEYIIMTGGFIMFFLFIILFFQVFNAHDYYLITMLNIFVIILCLLVRMINNSLGALLNSNTSRIFVIIFIGLLTCLSGIKARGRINFNDKWMTKSIAYNETEYKLMEYFTWYEHTRYEVLEDPSFNIDKVGITKQDTVICIGDKTINRALYLIDRVGYSSYNIDNIGIDNIAKFIEEKRKKGLKYIILIEPDYLNNENLKPYLTNKIFEEKSTSIYKL